MTSRSSRVHIHKSKKLNHEPPRSFAPRRPPSPPHRFSSPELAFLPRAALAKQRLTPTRRSNAGGNKNRGLALASVEASVDEDTLIVLESGMQVEAEAPETEVLLICQKSAFPQASKWIKSTGHLQRQNAFLHWHEPSRESGLPRHKDHLTRNARGELQIELPGQLRVRSGLCDRCAFYRGLKSVFHCYGEA
jgi:hypothetical protein